MKYSFSITMLMFAVFATVHAQQVNSLQKQKAGLAVQIEQSIQKALLAPWYPKSIDSLYGGFVSGYNYNFTPAANQDKMIVTQSRHIWVNAKASELYGDKDYFKYGAAHGFRFLRDVMWDKTHGGFYTLVDQQGKVKSDGVVEKEAYGNAFAIFALAAYYKSSGDKAALELAKKTFHWLEAHSHDRELKGYFQHMHRDGTVFKRPADEPSTSVRGYKDQNSSIHLLEAFAELYQVWPDALLRERLNEMLLLIRDVITTPKGNLVLFFTPDWKPVSFASADKATILKHRYVDHVSFGHDVETAYLLLEASHILGWTNDSTTARKAKIMVDHALENGWDGKLGGFYDEGYYFSGDAKISITQSTKNWWAQAEGLNTLLLMHELYPADQMRYFDKFVLLWNYSDKYLIDHVYGDWYEGGLDKQPQAQKAQKGHIWKATYHQFRSLSNCVKMLREGVQH